jgi:hypothetical protein
MKRFLAAMLLVGGSLAAAPLALEAQTAPVASAPAAPPAQSALAALSSFVFDLGPNASVEGGKVPLANGKWKDPAEGGSTFTLLPVHATGDLDGDGVADAAVVLQEATSGTGTFAYLFAIKTYASTPTQLGAPEWLGDRSVVERLSIDRKGILSVRFLTHKDGDSECCPTLRISDRFRIDGGKLVGITQ